MRQLGRVVALERAAVWVETQRVSACGRCAAGIGCGLGNLAGSDLRRPHRVRAVSGDELSVTNCELNDPVVIELSASALLLGAAVAYALPVGLAVLLALAASHYSPWHGGDWLVAGGFIGGMLVGLLAARHGLRALAASGRFEPRLVARCGAAATETELIASSATR